MESASFLFSSSISVIFTSTVSPTLRTSAGELILEVEMAARAAEKAERDAERVAEEERLAQERADMAPYIVGSID